MPSLSVTLQHATSFLTPTLHNNIGTNSFTTLPINHSTRWQLKCQRIGKNTQLRRRDRCIDESEPGPRQSWSASALWTAHRFLPARRILYVIQRLFHLMAQFTTPYMRTGTTVLLYQCIYTVVIWIYTLQQNISGIILTTPHRRVGMTQRVATLHPSNFKEILCSRKNITLHPRISR